MNRNTASITLLVLWVAGISGLALAYISTTADHAATPEDQVQLAWAQAKQAGAYHFTSEIIQTTHPVASVTNIGQRSQQTALHLEGHTNLPARQMELTLWSNGGSVQDVNSGLAMRVEGDRAFAKQGDQDWQEVNNFTNIFAQHGDLLAFVTAAQNISIKTNCPLLTDTDENSQAGCYTFEIDGPRYATYVRDQLQSYLAEKGELPPNINLSLPETYQHMTGHGELWINAEGLPRREIIHLEFPAQPGADHSITADLTIDFSNYTLTTVQAAGSGWGIGQTLWRALPDPRQGLLVALTLVGCWLLFQPRFARRLYPFVALGLIINLIFAPTLNNAQAAAFTEKQTAQAEAQRARQDESNLQRTVQGLKGQTTFDPHHNPLQSAAPASLPPVAPNNFPSLMPQNAASATSPTDPADSDADGLTNYMEEQIGTDLLAIDSDRDNVNDNLETLGFDYAGKHWYADPLKDDTNGDGLDDGREWYTGAVSGLPADTNGNGVPDLFDFDNDGDGVPDKQDLSPYQKSQTFTGNNPFLFKISNLTAGQPTYVEFQLRPTDPNQLGYALNVLDWPVDKRGQVQDGDGKTFYDVATDQSATPLNPNVNGDLRVVPMLELTLDNENGVAPARLPPMSALETYGIGTRCADTLCSKTLVYIPLQLVTDNQQGRVAFQGKMLYIAPGVTWGRDDSVRLVWLAQMLVDECTTYFTDPEEKHTSPDCQGYRLNQLSVVQTYPGDWVLTGLNIREDHGTDVALVYEDPTVDADLHSDETLFGLAYGLERSFLVGRDDNNNGRRDLDIVGDQGDTPLYLRFDLNYIPSPAARWNLSDTLQVETRRYAHQDLSLASVTITESKAILNTAFTSVWSAANPVTPTLLIAREARFRTTNLDALNAGYVTWERNILSVNLAPNNQPAEPLRTALTLNLAPYCYNGSAWKSCDIQNYWDTLGLRHEPYAADPGDDPDTARGKLTMIQLYYLSLYQGVTLFVSPQASNLNYQVAGDAELGNTIFAASNTGAKQVVKILINKIGLNTEVQSGAKSLLKWLGKLVGLTQSSGGLSTWQKFLGSLNKNITTKNLFKAGAVMFAVVFALLTLAIVFGASGGDTRALRITGAIFIAMALFVIQVVLPFKATIEAIQRLVKQGVGLLQATTQILSSSTSVIKSSVIASVIGLVIGLSVATGIFIFQLSLAAQAGPLTWFVAAPLVAQFTASVGVAIFTFVIGLTVVGALALAIVSFIDTALTVLCHVGGIKETCFSLTGMLTDLISGRVTTTSSGPVVDLENPDLMQFGRPQFTLADPLKGMVAGNTAQLSLGITTTIQPWTGDGASRGTKILSGNSMELMRRATFRYSLTNDEALGLRTEPTVRLGQSYVQWQFTQPEALVATKRDTVVSSVLLRAGMNQNLGAYLQSAYVVPTVACTLYWCQPQSQTQTETRYDFFPLGEKLIFDVFPATFAEFYQLTAIDGARSGFRLSWDLFPTLKDADGDGLLAKAAQGIDPDDSQADTDHDGLTDAYEFTLGANPVVADSDNDGLNDLAEVRAGTDPLRTDTDSDGLNDSAEVNGWEITVAGRLFHVTPNPFSPDGDDDGLTDLAERNLSTYGKTYHPSVWNPNPFGVFVSSSDADNIVKPGQTFTYTTLVSNTLGTTFWNKGVVELNFAPSLGGETRNLPVGLTSLNQSGTEATLPLQLTIPPNAPSGPAPMTSLFKVQVGAATTSYEIANPSGLSPRGGAYALRTTHGAALPNVGFANQYASLAYQIGTQGADGEIYLYGANGTPQLLLSYLGPGKMVYQTANLACALNGNCVAVYGYPSGDIFAQPIQTQPDPSGRGQTQMVVSAPVGIAGGTAPSPYVGFDASPSIASDGDGFLAVYINNDTLYARRLNNAGATIGAPFVVVPRVDDSTVNSSLGFWTVDMVWAGDRYWIAYGYRFRAAGTRNLPYSVGYAVVSKDGSVLGFGNVNSGYYPSLAYSPHLQKVLVAYSGQWSEWCGCYIDNRYFSYTFSQAVLASTASATGVGGFTAPTPLVSGSQAPRVAYDPFAQQWLIGWSSGQFYYRYWSEAGLGPVQTATLLEGVGAESDLVCSLPQQAPTLSLPFEERFLSSTQPAYDASGYGRNATCADGACPTTLATGKLINSDNIYAFNFDGNNDALTVALPTSATDNVALSLWVNWRGGGLPDQMLLYNGDATGYGLSVNRDTRLVSVINNLTPVATNFNLPTNTWVHLLLSRANGVWKLYANGAAVNVTGNPAPTPPGWKLWIGQSPSGNSSFNGALDDVRVYNTGLGADAARVLYGRQENNTCRAYAPAANLNYANLSLRKTLDGLITQQDTLSMTVDSDLPTSVVTSLANSQVVRVGGVVTDTGTIGSSAGNVLIIGGTASDPTSRVTGVEVRVSGGLWQPAMGTDTWAFPLQVTGEGRYVLHSRATDVVGNVENAPPSTAILVDNTPPQVNTTNLSNQPLQLSKQSDDFVVVLRGTVTDPIVGQFAGAGPKSVEIQLTSPITQTDGGGWQAATLDGNAWNITYTLPTHVGMPTGAYTVTARATDQAGNVSADMAQGILFVDNTAPRVTLGSTSIGQAEVAHYLLDEAVGATTFADLSGAGNSGGCSGAACPTAGQAGHSGNALSFNGLDDFIAIPDTATLRPSQFTLSAWFVWDDLGTNNVGFITSKGVGNFEIQTGGAAGINGLRVIPAGGPSIVDVPNAIHAGWNHVEVVYTGSETRVYMDGVLRGARANITGANDLTTNASPLNLGRRPDVSFYFKGKIDDVRLFNQAILPAQSNGAMLQLPFDEPANATRFADLSGANNPAGCSGIACPTANVSGQFGAALNFDGADDFVSVPDTVHLHSPQFTLSAWFAWGGFGTNAINFITGKGLNNYEIHTGGGAGVNGLRVIPAGAATTLVDVPNAIHAGWNHVVVVYTGRETQVYLDGVLRGTRTGVTGANNLMADTAAFTIGRRGDATFNFDGQVDEVRLFNRSLAPQEIGALYLDRQPNNIVFHLPFDEAAGASSFVDLSGNSHLAACSGGGCPASGGSGKIGNALTFDGVNDAMIILDTVALRPPQFTLATWFVWDGLGTSNVNFLTSKGNPATNLTNFEIHTGGGAGVNGLRVIPAGTSSIVDVPNAIHAGWNHVALVYTGSETRVYMDGILRATRMGIVGANDLTADTNTLHIGRRSDNTLYFKGQLDHLQLLNRALTDQEIRMLVEQSQPTVPVFHLPLNESAGATAFIDASSNGNAGGCSGATCPVAGGNGQLGKALTLDGFDDYVSVADTAALRPLTYTLSAWFVWDGFGTDAINFITGKDIGNYEIHTGGGAGVNGLRVLPAGYPASYVDVPNAIHAGWNHVALVYTSREARVYVDGVLRATRTGIVGASNLAADAMPFNIGRRSNGAFYFKGQIDDVRLFNRALTASEIADLSQTNLPTQFTDQRTLWGEVSDAGPVSTGVSSVELRFVPLAQAEILDSATVALPFDEPVGATTFVDAAGAGLGDCSGTTCPTAGQGGQVGTALKFDGANDYVSIPAARAAPPLFTLSMWFVWDGLGTNTIQFLAGKGYENYEVQTGGLAGVNGLRFMPAGSLASGVNLPNAIHAGWNHVAVVYNGSGAYIYVDGVLRVGRNGIVGANNLAADLTPLNLGRRSDNSFFFKGLIDDVRLYNTAFSIEQVANLYQAGLLQWQRAEGLAFVPGSANRRWSATLPPLEGVYRLDMRTTDALGNSQMTPNVWRGPIDNSAPRLAYTRFVMPTAQCWWPLWGCELYNYTFSVEDYWVDGTTLTTPCDAGALAAVPRFDSSQWWLTNFPSTPRLNRYQINCSRVPGVAFEGPFPDNAVLRACDRYGTCSEARVGSYLPPAPPAPPDAPAATDPLLITQIMTPSSVLTTTAPLSVTGGVYAENYARAVTVTVNNSVFYATTWASNTLTVTTWVTSWAPTGEGDYVFFSMLSDWAGNVTSSTFTITVDTQAPALSLTSNVITQTHQASSAGVVISGLVTDTGKLAKVEAQLNNGDWVEANVSGNAWNATLFPSEVADGDTYTLTARATDVANRQAVVTNTLLIDLAPPIAVTTTLAYQNSLAQTRVITSGVTLTDATSLLLNWTPSPSNDLNQYYVGWTTTSTPTLTALTAYTPAATLAYTLAVGGSPQILYPYVVGQDARGNTQHQTAALVYVDAPGTPDLITDLAYHGWLGNGCTWVGTSRSALNAAPEGATFKATQKFYASWDATALRLTWQGANWDTDGDLFIYLDTKTGGAEEAYNPYSATLTNTSIYLPGNSPDGSPFVSNLMRADYLVWVKDATTAQLMRWNGSAWVSPTLLSPTQYQLTPEFTDLYLPFNLVSLTSPATKMLKLIAFATEDDALRVWATMPGYNLLNSRRVQELTADPTSPETLLMSHMFTWDGLGAGVCPNANLSVDSALEISLSAEPEGVAYNFVSDALFDLWDTLIDGSTGLPDDSLDFLDTNYPFIPDQQTLTYTVRYANLGTTTAQSVTVSISAYDTLRLPGGTRDLQPDGSSYDYQTLDIGEIAPGTGGVMTFTGRVDVVDTETEVDNCLVVNAPPDPLECTVMLDWASIDAIVNDSQTENINAPLEWIWLDHAVDHLPPEAPKINAPLDVIHAGDNLANGTVGDESLVPTLTLEIKPVGGSFIASPCADPTPADGEWQCVFNPGAANNGDQFVLRAKATDTFGQVSAWSSLVTLTVDTVAPTVTVDSAVTQALSTTLLRDGATLITGMAFDNQSLSAVDVCLDDPLGQHCAPATLKSALLESSAKIYTDVPASAIPINANTSCVGQAITRTFNITDTFIVGQVRFGFNADHPYRGDVLATLTSPAGTEVALLYNDSGEFGEADNFDVWLSDAAADPAQVAVADDPGAPYFDRAARPYEPLRAFINENARGRWTLRLCDTFPPTDDGAYNRSQLWLLPSDAAQTNQVAWTYTLAQLASGDNLAHTLYFFPTDEVGNRATQPTRLDYHIDTVAPEITVTALFTENTDPINPLVTLTGTVSDGGGVSEIHVRVYQPDADNTLLWGVGQVNGLQWSYTFTPTLSGQYALWLEVSDQAGNLRLVGPFAVNVTRSNFIWMPLVLRDAPPPTPDSSLLLEAPTLEVPALDTATPEAVIPETPTPEMLIPDTLTPEASATDTPDAIRPPVILEVTPTSDDLEQ